MSTVETSWEIVHTLQDMGEAGVTELSEELGIPKPTVYTHLATLKQERYVIKRGSAYSLGLRFSLLGESVKNKYILYEAGRTEVEALAKESGEYVHLVTEESNELIYLHNARGENAVGSKLFQRKFEDPGHFHTMSCGKALLAFLPDEKIDRIIEESSLPRQTERTITDERELQENLETIRERGFALNDQEEIMGTRAVGAPIFDEDSVIGAVSMTKPTSRMNDKEFYETVPETVMRAANGIEVNVQILRNKGI